MHQVVKTDLCCTIRNGSALWQKVTWIFISAAQLSFIPLLKCLASAQLSKKEDIQVWNNMKGSKWWQHFYFYVNYSFRRSSCRLPYCISYKLYEKPNTLKVRWNDTTTTMQCRPIHWVVEVTYTLHFPVGHIWHFFSCCLLSNHDKHA